MMTFKQKKAGQINIAELLASMSRISDVRFSSHREEIIFLTSKDGKGELYVGNDKGEKKKISQDLNIRGTVGYGGDAFDVIGNLVVACEKNGDIYKINLSNDQPTIQKLASNKYKTCSPRISPDKRWILFIFDDNEVGGIGIAPLTGLSWPRQLIMGADFYMHPTWHPNGEMITWVEWDHPNMPWDASVVKTGQVGGMQLRLFEENYIDGGLHSSANQPRFSPDGNWLSYIKRDGNWDNLVLYNLETKEKKIAVRGDGFHLRIPDWIQGVRSYHWSSDSKFIYFIKYIRGTATIAKVGIKNNQITPIDISPYFWASQIDIGNRSNQAVFIGSSTTTSNQIVFVSDNKVHDKLRNDYSQIDWIPKPMEISFKTDDGSQVFAWFFPPVNDANQKGLPPCIINIHSGPTSVKHAGYSLNTIFFTTSGYAVVYLNYRGSVTFGYDYQDALRRKWGEVEISDTVHLVDELKSRNLIHPDKVAVMGSSAGGFSILHLLIKHPELFKAGICSYPVSDLVDDASNTHKFEKYYHRFLTGEFPEEYDRFLDRSPLTHIDRINIPIALFQGAKDNVVSPSQTQKIFDSLKKRGVPCLLKIYENEGHGFRIQENIEDYYSTTIDFLSEHLQ